MTDIEANFSIASQGDIVRGWAEYYSAHGLVVAPAAGKVPVANWGLIRANDRSLFGHPDWFGPMSKANIVILTGRLSGIFAVDIDVSNGKLGAQSLKALEAKHGPLPNTLCATTGTGGRHYYFKLPPVGPDEKVVTVANAFKDEGLPDIDIRGDGGVIVAPPSIHPITMRTYTWDADLTAAPLLSLIADAPQWLIDKVVRRKRIKHTNVSSGAYEHLLGAPAIAKLLSKACTRIEQADNGEQELTLFAMSKDMGKLVGAGALDYHEAHAALLAAGLSMKTFNPARPWTMESVREKVELSLAKGIMAPEDLSWVKKWKGKSDAILTGRNLTEDQLASINDEFFADLFTWKRGLTGDVSSHEIEQYISRELPRINLLPYEWQEGVYDQIMELFPASADLVARIRQKLMPAELNTTSVDVHPQVSEFNNSSVNLGTTIKPLSEFAPPPARRS